MDQNGFHSSEHGIRESTEYRLNYLEKCAEDLGKFSDDLRISKMSQEGEILRLKETLERHEKDIASMKTATGDLGIMLNRRIDDLRETLTAKIEFVRSTNSKWSIAILTAIIISVVGAVILSKL